MRTSLLRLLLFILLVGAHESVVAQYKWVRGGGSTASISSPDLIEATYFSCTDANGNVYCLSEVGNSGIIVDTFHHNAYGLNQNGMFTSYTCDGRLRFAKLITSSSSAIVQGIVADTTGHIYLAVDLPHGTGGSPYTVHIGYDTSFSATTPSGLRQSIIQYDTSGHFNWIRFVGTNTAASYNIGGTAVKLTMDGNNNADLLCPMYAGVVISSTVTSVKGYYDLKYSSFGTLLSAKRLQLDTLAYLKTVTIDKSNGKLFAVGAKTGSSYDLNYVTGFDTARNMIWFDTFTCPPFVGAAGASSIVADNIGHLYFCGNATGSVVYQHDTLFNTLSTGTSTVSFIMKIDTANNLKWARGYSIIGSSINYFNGITLLSSNKIAATGLMAGTLVGGGDTITTYSGEGQNAFFTIVDTGGYVHTLQQIHGVGFYDAGRSITSDKTGSLFISGYIATNVWADTLTHYNSVGGNSDFFTMKYGAECNCSSLPFASYTSMGAPTVNFTYNGTATGIDSVHWRFGDGAISNSMSPVHTYAAPGHYTACVSVYSSCGNDEVCHDIYIPCIVAPTAAFTSSAITATRNFTYTGTTVGLDSVVWNYGDGGHGTGNTSTHTYTAPGTYSACVTAYSPCGSNTSCSTITITCVTAPVAAFTNSGAPTTSFTYTGTTTGLDSVSWRYGDGTQGSGLTTVHTYTLGGTYTACAIAYNHCGWDSACTTVTVPCVPPVANFSHTGTLVQNFNYTGTTPGIDSIVWDYGDGNTGHGSVATHTYTIEGTYHVCVTAYSYCASDSFCSDIVITCPAPVAAITNTNDTFHYTGTTPTIDSIVWDFGDGFTDTGMAPVHPYAVTDTYHVCVRVYGYCGADTICSDFIVTGVGISTITLYDISVYPNPATNQVNIEGVTALMSYRVMTVTGSVQQVGPLKVGTNRLDMSKYPPGVYMIELLGGEGSRRTFRVIKE